MDSYVYIMTNKQKGTLYIGVTSDLVKRVYEHKHALCDGFTSKYNLDKLVFYEIYSNIAEAITREKQLKAWRRDWKLKLIEDFNINWNDLYQDIV